VFGYERSLLERRIIRMKRRDFAKSLAVLPLIGLYSPAKEKKEETCEGPSYTYTEFKDHEILHHEPDFTVRDVTITTTFDLSPEFGIGQISVLDNIITSAPKIILKIEVIRPKLGGVTTYGLSTNIPDSAKWIIPDDNTLVGGNPIDAGNGKKLYIKFTQDGECIFSKKERQGISLSNFKVEMLIYEDTIYEVENLTLDSVEFSPDEKDGVHNV